MSRNEGMSNFVTVSYTTNITFPAMLTISVLDMFTKEAMAQLGATNDMCVYIVSLCTFLIQLSITQPYGYTL